MALRSSLHDRTPRRRRTLARWIKRALLVLGGLAILGAIVYGWLPKPVPVEVSTARHAPLVVEIDEDGKTRVRDRFVVAAPISGNLLRIDLEAGSRVAAGDVVARIAPPDVALLDERTRDEARARLAAAVAHERAATTSIARATAARDSAVRDADRARTLESHAAITGYERERAELAEELARRDLAAAEADHAAAIAEVEAARATLGLPGTRGAGGLVAVHAPAAGQVLKVVRDSAGPVLAGAPLIELGDPHALEVVVDVLSSDAAQVRPGMEVVLEGWGGGEPLHARVREVEPSAFTQISALGVEEQRVNVIASLDTTPANLGDGFRVDARIITWRGDVLAVPSNAVFRDRERWAVYVVEAGRTRLVPVELGHRGRTDVEITSGLDDGAEVVLHPGDRVKDGTRVQCVETR